MKKLRTLLAVAVVAIVAAMPAQAQFRFGVKGGIAVNKLSFSEDIIKSDNRAGFTGGVMVDFTVPIIGIGCDASVLYARRSLDVSQNTLSEVSHRDYIDVPVNLKWKLDLPAVNKIIAPFVTTGPDFSFLLSKQNVQNAFKNRTFDLSWNIGLGVELFRHVQIAGSYGIGITESASGGEAMNSPWKDLSGKGRVWTITAAILF